MAKGQSLPPDTDAWYVNAHCYTVLSYDSGTATVNIRNPWARHPDPDGIFNLPLSQLFPCLRRDCDPAVGPARGKTRPCSLELLP